MTLWKYDKGVSLDLKTVLNIRKADLKVYRTSVIDANFLTVKRNFGKCIDNE